MSKKELKNRYKEAIMQSLKNIEENADDIIDFAFKKSTKNIKIQIKIEPGGLVSWDCIYDLNFNSEPITFARCD